MAAQLGYTDIFEVLARHGADIDARLPSSETAVELARAHHHSEITVFLSGYRRELQELRRNSAVSF
jgi:ankyrin repeat protein